MEAELDSAKKERYYRGTQNDMMRDLIRRGLDSLKEEPYSDQAACIKNRHIDFFLDDEIEICFEPDGYNEILKKKFWIRDSVYDEKSGYAIISADKLTCCAS